MANTTVLHHATVLKSKSEETIKKEVARDLLEDPLTLFIPVRSFSFAKDKQQAYKIQQSRIRVVYLGKRSSNKNMPFLNEKFTWWCRINNRLSFLLHSLKKLLQFLCVLQFIITYCLLKYWRDFSKKKKMGAKASF